MEVCLTTGMKVPTVNSPARGAGGDSKGVGVVEVEAPAKVNLFLEVLGRRGDGYHELETVYQEVGLCDNLRLCPSGEFRLEVEGPWEVPLGEDNLVVRAARALARRLQRPPTVAIHLRKRIPAGSGLGGGSSDAAATLVGLNRLWRAGLGREELATVAAEVGSDVAFFLHGGAARGRGRGEILQPIRSTARFWCVVHWPGASVATSEVYRRLDEEEGEDRRRSSEGVVEALERGEIDRLGREMFNRLAGAARRVLPVVGEAMEALRRAGASVVQVAGSGSAVFTVCPTQPTAQRIARRLRRCGFGAVWVAQARNRFLSAPSR